MTEDEAARRRRNRLTLIVCCSALFMTSLDNTILNVALPSLQRSLHSSAAGLQWAVDGYILVRAGTLFLTGSVGDRFGRRRVFAAGLVVFVLASLCCSLAPTLQLLIAARAVQGAGSALMTPSSLAIITNTFTEPRERAQAVGIWSATAGLSTAAGPVLGGLLVETLGWRSVFWVNVPIGLAALLGTRLVLESSADEPRPFDIPGQVAIAVTVATLTYALISGPETSWTSPVVLVMLAVSVIGAYAFIRVERRVRQPLLELRYFANPALVGAVALAIVAFIALGAFLFFNTLYLQRVRGLSPLEAGLLTVPTTISTIVLAPLSGRITGTRGARGPAVIACGLMCAGMAVLAGVVAPQTPLGIMVIGYVLLGCGMGLINPPITNAAVSGMPAQRAGVAGATTSTARQIGTNLGVALVGSVVFSAGGVAAVVGGGHGLATAAAREFCTGLRYGFGLAAALAAGCVLLSAWAFTERRAGSGRVQAGTN